MKTTAKLTAWNRRGIAFGGALLAAACALLSPSPARAEAILQVFNQSHNEIAARLPEIAEAGYTALWVPPPTKANGGMSVGYDLNDPFDLGNSDLRGTWSTRYGTEADLHNLIAMCHRFGMRVYFDNVMNHRSYDIPGFNESTPTDVYPGMCPEDFHVRTTSDGFYRKWDNVRSWDDEWQVMFLGLSDLLDIAHENYYDEYGNGPYNANFGPSEGGWHLKPFIVRYAYHKEDTWKLFDRMPYPGKSNDDYRPGDGALQNTDGDNGVNLYTGFENISWNPEDPATADLISANAFWFDEHDARNGVSMKLIEDFPNFYKEQVDDYLNRAVRWLVDRTKVDGLRLDAVKHVPYDFYGASWGDDKDGSNYGYMGQAQWQFNMTRGFYDWDNHRDTVFAIDSPRNDLMAFGEHLGSPPPQGPYVSTGMRLVDDRLRNELNSRLGRNQLEGFDNEYAGSELGPDCGVMHAQSHDNDYVDRKPLHHAIYFMRRGLGLVYSDGNNHAATLSGSGGAFPRWAQTDFLGQWGQRQIPTLLHAHENFARYGQWGKWSQGNFVAWQRGGEGSWATMLFQLNAGWDFWQDSTTAGDFGSDDFYLYDYASDMYMPHRHDDGWSEAPYVYGTELATGYVEIPPNSYAIWALKNPDPSALYPSPYPDCFVNTDDRIIAPDSRVITIMEDGKVVDPVMVVRKDGVDGDPNFNPYGVADTNATDYAYTIAIPRVTGGTNVTLAVKGDGSAETLMLRLDGGMDFGNGIEGTRQDGDRAGWKDLRDNPPGAAHDFDLGFEVTTNWFTRRIWSEKFAAPDSDYCWIGTSGAHTYQVTIGSAITVETNTTAYSGASIEAPAFVWHHPLMDTEPLPVAVASAASASTSAKVSAKSATLAVKALVPRASAGWIGASYIFANDWYKGDGQYNGEWAPGNFNNTNLGIITNTLYFGGQAQTYGESDGEGNPARIRCNILSGSTTVATYTSTMYWFDYQSNNNFFESRTGNSGTWLPLAIDLSGLEDGATYTLSVWFEANGASGNVYDNNGGSNYKATFTVALDGGGGGEGGGGDDPTPAPGTRATWIGKSYVNANSTWYNASGREATDPDAWWPEAGNFNGKNLGYLRTLEVGGQAQTYQESDGENHPARMGWNLLSGGTIVSNGTISLPWLVYTNNNNYFQSGGSTFATTSIDLSGLIEGTTYSLAVWFEADAADGSTYDNNGGANYVATFTYGDAPAIDTRVMPQFQADANGTTIWAKTSQEQGARSFLYYTTDGIHWPEGGGGVPANPATTAIEGSWVANTDSGSWWRFQLPAFASGTPLRYKVSAFREMGYDGNVWNTVWPGNGDAIRNKKVMMSLWTIPGLDFTTQQYHKHLDYNSWTTGFEDGYHLVTARLFLNRNDGAPVANTFRQTFYLDRHTPNGFFLYPSEENPTFGDSDYGMVIKTDNTVDHVWVHITDSDDSNDGIGNGFTTNGVVEWAPAVQLSPWTREMAQDTETTKIWRFNYSQIPHTGTATIRVRLCEVSSAPVEDWSTTDPALDNPAVLHVTELVKTANTRGPEERFFIEWPDSDGTLVEAGWDIRVKYTARMVQGLTDDEIFSKFKIYVNSTNDGSTVRGDLQPNSELDMRHEWDWGGDGSGLNTLTFRMPNVYNGIDSWRYALTVDFDNENGNGTYSKSATRLIRHKGALLPTCIITTPPETDSDGVKWIITMEDSTAAATNRTLRETPIVVLTDSEATRLDLAFVSPTNYQATISALYTTNSAEFPSNDVLRLTDVASNGTSMTWTFAWQVTNAGAYRFEATVTADNSAGKYSVDHNTATRSANIQFRQLVHVANTNDLDWDDDGVLNVRENDSIELPKRTDETWTQDEVFDYWSTGKSDPACPDSDGDGLPDGLELGYRAAPDGTDSACDTNGDGWPNFIGDIDPPFYNTLPSKDSFEPGVISDAGTGADRTRMVVGSVTDPRNPDSDFDGIPDGLEDANHNGWTEGDGNPLPTDWNPYKEHNWADGKMAGETWEETSPCIADSDADGLSDGYGEDKNGNGYTDMALLQQDGTLVPITPSDYATLGIGIDNVSSANSSSTLTPKPYTSRAINYDALFAAFNVTNPAASGTKQTNGWPRLVITETDPLCTDTDHDGLPDGWENNYSLDPLNNGVYDFRTGQWTDDPTHGARGNPDGDTYIQGGETVPYDNAAEFTGGTNPRNNDSESGGGASGAGSITIGAGDEIGEINGTKFYTEYTQWTLDDLVALDNYDQGGNSSDIYRCNDEFNSSRDLVAFYFRDGGDPAAGGDGKLYFRVDLDDLKAFAEDSALNIYVAMNFGNYGNGITWLPDDVNCESVMRWNAVVGVYDSQNGCLYVQNGEESYEFKSGYYGAYFNSELDIVAWSIDRKVLTDAGWNGMGDKLLFQVYTTRDFTNDDGGSGDKGGLNDFTDTIGDDWICSDYGQDWNYIHQNGKYSTCVSKNGSSGWNDCGKHAKLAIVAHGNQAVEPAHTMHGLVDNGSGAGYQRPVKIHNIYTNCPMNLHITPTLAMAMEWAAVGTEKTWFSGPAFNDAIRQGIAKGAFSLLGSTYSDHVLKYYPDAFNAANAAMAEDTLNAIYGNGEKVVSSNVFWLSERVADWNILQKLARMGYQATVVDQTPHLLEWFGRETALGNDAYKIQRYWAYGTDSTQGEEIKAFVLSSAADQFRFANTDSGLSSDLRHLFLRRARTGEAAISSIFYRWEDFTGTENADGYDRNLRWIANHPWIQVVTLDQALTDETLSNALVWKDVTADDGMGMQDWVHHACNGNYDYWYYGDASRGIHSRNLESLADKVFEVRQGTNLPSGTVYGDATNGIVKAAWAAVAGITNANVKRLAEATIFASAFETAFHDEDDNNLDRWSFGEYMFPAGDRDKGLMSMSWRAQSRTRLAAVFAEVDAWATANDGLKAYSKDIDLDGEPEYILRNNKVMAIFEAEGGLMTGAWLKDGANVWQMVGNFAAQPETGYETQSATAESTRGTAMKDITIGGTSTVADIFDVTVGSGELTFKKGTTLTKTVSLADATANAFSISYTASDQQMYVRNALSPDLATLLLRGQAAMSEESSSSGNTITVTTAYGTNAVAAALSVTTGSINTAATDKDGDWDTVSMRNAAQARNVEVSGTGSGSLAYTIAFTSSEIEPPEPEHVAPAWSDLPAPAITTTTNYTFTPANFATGIPAPDITLRSAGAPDGTYTFEDGEFTFTPSVIGAYHFVFRATNEAGQADATLTISVTAAPYDQWMAAKGIVPPPDPNSTNGTACGQTYEWHYVTDIHPTNDTPLEIVITNAASGTFTIPAASPNRLYNLLWTTDLTQSFTTNDLGLGNPSQTIRFPTTGSWYGGLEVTIP